jgi:hypothetical protein
MLMSHEVIGHDAIEEIRKLLVDGNMHELNSVILPVFAV